MTPTEPPQWAAFPQRKGGSDADGIGWGLWLTMAGVALVFLSCSIWRHLSVNSTAWDLGVYDQVVYLLSRGLPPVSSFLQFHFLGDHVSLAVYPVALLYRIYPTVFWLFGVQTLCLVASGAFTWKLARLHGLDSPTSRALGAALLLYPGLFNVNLFDFHPDALALPGILGALVAAKRNRMALFCTAIVWVMACKAPFSLTVLALGFCLVFVKNRRAFGAAAMIAGALWFWIATQIVIPIFSGGEAAGVARFGYLGDSVLAIMASALKHPGLVAQRALAPDSLKYLGLTAVVFIWWIAPRHAWALLPALPTILMNVLGEDPKMRTLSYQYCLPVLPFLLWAVVGSLEDGSGTLWSWLRRRRDSPGRAGVDEGLASGERDAGLMPRAIVLWAALMLAWLGVWGRAARQLSAPANLEHIRAAVTLIPPSSSVLTDNRLAPQITQRPVVRLLDQEQGGRVSTLVEYVLLDLARPWPDTQQETEILAASLRLDPAFEVAYEGGGILLFGRDP